MRRLHLSADAEDRAIAVEAAQGLAAPRWEIWLPTLLIVAIGTTTVAQGSPAEVAVMAGGVALLGVGGLFHARDVRAARRFLALAASSAPPPTA